MFTFKRIIKSNQYLFQKMKAVLIYIRYVKSFVQTDEYKRLGKISHGITYFIEEEGYHCWFGYYDKSPMNSSNRYIVYTKVIKNAKPGDTAEVCVFDTKLKKSRIVGTTTTWNWQQGSMLEWINETQVRYNAFDNIRRQYITRVVDVVNGNEISYSRACYASNKDKTAFLSLNFYRLDNFAKGYGYPYKVDEIDNNTDGIWETLVSDNKVTLLLPLQKVINYNKTYDDDCQHYINHVTYCPNEELILFIHRWQKIGTEFSSRLLLFDKKSKKLDTLLDNGHVSHFCWKSHDELMIYATNKEGIKGYMVVDINNKTTEHIQGMPKEDGHPSYSNDGTLILTDTYPNNHRDQYLLIYNSLSNKLKVLDKLYSPFEYFNDKRCDLHPRWSMDNKYIIIDSTEKGRRAIKVFEYDDINSNGQ